MNGDQEIDGEEFFILEEYSTGAAQRDVCKGLRLRDMPRSRAALAGLYGCEDCKDGQPRSRNWPVHLFYCLGYG